MDVNRQFGEASRGGLNETCWPVLCMEEKHETLPVTLSITMTVPAFFYAQRTFTASVYELNMSNGDEEN